MKKISIISVLILALVLPSLAFCKSSKGMPKGQWWRKPKIAQSINLTDVEKTQLEAKYLESQRVRLDLKSKLEKEMFELDVLLNQNASDKKMMAQYQSVADARAKLGEELMRFNLEVRKIIGDERFNKLKDMAKSWRKKTRSGKKSGGTGNLSKTNPTYPTQG